MDKRIIRKVKKYIDSVVNQQPGLISAFIFGSYANNRQRLESDIDVALVIDNLSDLDRFDTQVRLMLLASRIDNRIEPHPISTEDINSNNPFAVEIRRTGVEIKIK
jgi:predicted nucleotidyltransferase